MELSPAAGRVLGALVEKERTTPQAYPLTDNALLAACNQTTSRDPVVSYDVATVRMAVRELRELGLLRTVHRTGERSDKHRHEIEQALGLSPGQVSLLAVLLLRGPQTLAELRSRTERMHPFAATDEVDRELLVLAERDEPLVALLERQPGRKEARFTQCLVPAPAPGAASAGAASAGAASAGAASAGAADALATVVRRREPGASDALATVVERTGGVPAEPASPSGLEAVVAELSDEVAMLRREVDELRGALERATGG